MKNIRYYLSLSCCITALLCITTAQPLSAQGQLNTPAAYELFKQRSLWMQSVNPAGAMLDHAIEFTEIGIGYRWDRGDFHLPQNGEKNNQLDIDVEGAAILRNLYAWGKFVYNRNDVYDARFNASIIDPLRGMPYYYADLDPSEWRMQLYETNFRMSSMKLWDALLVGIDGKYAVASGAKQRDMRTTNKSVEFMLRPGIVYLINPAYAVGLHFEYLNYKEESIMDKRNAEIGQTFYEMFGLGMSRSLGSGTPVTDYKGNKVSGGLQFNMNGQAVNMVLSGGYAYYVEDAMRSLDNPEHKLTTRCNEWRGDLQLYTNRKGSPPFTHFVNGSYLLRHIDGIQYVSEAPSAQDGTLTYTVLYSSVRSTYAQSQGGLSYAIVRNRGSEYNWKAEAGVTYIDRDDHYINPESKFNARSAIINLGAKKNFVVGQRLVNRLLVGLEAVYSNNLSGEYLFGGPNPDYPVVTELMQGNLTYLMSNYMRYNVSAFYSMKIKPELKANLIVGGTYSYVNPNSSDFNNRSILQVKIGCNF